MKVNEKNINNFKQNKIKYLVRDFSEYGVPEEVTREILLKRGINKWLYNRMLFINLKDELKLDIKYFLGTMKIAGEIGKGKESKLYRELVGGLRILNDDRQKIRKICHSNRWVFPE